MRLSFNHLPRLTLSLVLLSFFLSVFVRSNSVWGGDFSARQIYLYGASGLVLVVAGVGLVIRRSTLDLGLNRIDILMGLFWVWCLLRSFSMSGGFQPHEKLAMQLGLLIFYSATKILVRASVKENSEFLRIMVFSGVLLIGFFAVSLGVFQIYGINLFNAFATHGISGTLGNPDFYGGYLAIIAVFALGVYMFLGGNGQWDRLLKYLGLFTFLSAVFVIPVTGSRASWLAFISGAVIFASVKLHIIERIKRLFLTRSKSTFLLPFFIVLVLATIHVIYGLKPDSAFGRFLIWKITFSMISRHLLLGIGFDRFKVAYENYQASYFATGSRPLHEIMVAGHVQAAYNEPLQTLAELGLIGEILFLLVVWSVIHAMVRSKDLEDWPVYPCGASFLAFVVLSSFDYPTEILPTLTLSFFFLACVSAQHPSYDPFRVRLSPVLQKLIGLLLFLLAIVFGTHSKAMYGGYQDWRVAYQATEAGNFSEAKVDYLKLLPVFKWNGEFLFMYGALLTLSKEYSKALPILERAANGYNDPKLWLLIATDHEGLGDLQQSEWEIKKASAMVPHEFYPRFLLMRLFVKRKEQDSAVVVAKEIMAMPVKVPSPAVTEIKEKADSLIQQKSSARGPAD